MNGTPKPDPVDEAIAATEQQPTVKMVQLQATIGSTGRPVAVVIPVDMSDAELLEVIGWMAASVRAHLAQQRPASRILVPGRLA